MMSAGDFALGEKFLQTMQCLDCHAMSGDGSVADVIHAKAPNLDLAWKRLREPWVRAWIQEPDIVRHGTNMPPYFTGLASGDLRGQPLAEAQKLSPEQAGAVSQFGRTVEQQTRLLMDFFVRGWREGLYGGC